MNEQSLTAQMDFMPGDHAAVDRVPGAFAERLGNEVIFGGLGERFRRDLLLRQPAAQILERQRHIQQLRMLRRPRASWRCTGR